MGQAHHVTIVLKLREKQDNTITRERGILTRLIKRLIKFQREEYYINPEGRKRIEGGIHQIHQFQWR